MTFLTLTLLSSMLTGGDPVDDAFLMPVRSHMIQDPETTAFYNKLSARFTGRPTIDQVWDDAWMQKEVRVPGLQVPEEEQEEMEEELGMF